MEIKLRSTNSLSSKAEQTALIVLVCWVFLSSFAAAQKIVKF